VRAASCVWRADPSIRWRSAPKREAAYATTRNDGTTAKTQEALVRSIVVLLLAACAQQPSPEYSPPFRLERKAAPESTPANSAWRTSFVDAEAAAKQREAPLLLFFDAKW
jgi:hypothetical protein